MIADRFKWPFDHGRSKFHINTVKKLMHDNNIAFFSIKANTSTEGLAVEFKSEEDLFTFILIFGQDIWKEMPHASLDAGYYHAPYMPLTSS